jgi:uncharacterized protein (DUF4415 family)
MNNGSSLRTSKTDWARINAMQDEDIDFSDAPEATEEQIARSTFRIGGVIVDGLGPTGGHRNKQAVHMVLDAAIVEYFKQQAGDQDYQNLMSVALLDYIQRNPATSKAA